MNRTKSLNNLYVFAINNANRLEIPVEHLWICALAGRVCYTREPKLDTDERLNKGIVAYLDKLSKWTHYSVFAHLPIKVHIAKEMFAGLELYNLFKVYYDKEEECMWINLRHLIEAWNVRGKSALSQLIEDLELEVDELIGGKDVLQGNVDGIKMIWKRDKLVLLAMDFRALGYDWIFYYTGHLVDRAMSHQIVRHQILNFNQQSQRYVKLKEGKLPIIEDEVMKKEAEPFYYEWKTDVLDVYRLYDKWLKQRKLPAEKARSVLPNATATNLVISGFVPDAKEFIVKRISREAQSEIREFAKLLEEVTK